MVRFEPIAAQLSGGQLLPLVQKLVATFICLRFLPKKMQIESTISFSVKDQLVKYRILCYNYLK